MTVGKQRDIFSPAPDDQKTGEQLRDEGMERVVENSGDWKDIAKAAMEGWFLAIPIGSEFAGEDIRLTLRSCIDPPHHSNAWSSVIGGRVRSWLGAGLIEDAGVRRAKDPTSHAHIMLIYRRIR